MSDSPTGSGSEFAAAGHAGGPGASAPGGTGKPWGGRFSTGQDPLFERLNASIPFDYVLAPFDIEGSCAHVRMLGAIGVLTADESDAILAGLAAVAGEVERGTFAWTLQDEDVHMAIERRLTELVGPVGGKVHTGRSRNDQVALDLQLYLRNAVSGHQSRVAGLMAALLEQAEKHAACHLPGIHPPAAGSAGGCCAPPAWPICFALQRDWERLEAWRQTSWMPLGAGALAGANYALDRDMVAAELGFAVTAPNSMDAVAARDTAFAYLSIAANCGLTLSRLAEELVLWSTQEFGLASLPESWTSGSSIMPQKRNPDAAELVRAKAAGFLARLQGMGVLLKGLPLAYNKDLQEDKLYVFGTKEELDLCLQAMTAMVRGPRVPRGPRA